MVNFVGTLMAVLPLVAAAPSGLSARDSSKPGCTSSSFDDSFTWKLEAFNYHAAYTFSTPAHQIASGSVDFNLTNPALDEQVVCTAYSTQLSDFFYGNFNYNCTGVPEGSTTETTFAFSRPSGQLDVNQTWTCTDADPTYPTTFHGYGTVDLDLNCKEDNYQNPDWKQGEIYSSRTITCEPVSLDLKPHDKTAVA